jgi:hypothetical protein
VVAVDIERANVTAHLLAVWTRFPPMRDAAFWSEQAGVTRDRNPAAHALRREFQSGLPIQVAT